MRDSSPRTNGVAPNAMNAAIKNTVTVRGMRAKKRPNARTATNVESAIKVRRSAELADALLNGSYRSLRFAWRATPRTRPVLVARRTAPTGVALYLSWNGATAVTHWQVLAGSSAGALRPVRTVADRSFETRIALTQTAGRYAVQALGAGGRVLATSPVVSPS